MDRADEMCMMIKVHKLGHGLSVAAIFSFRVNIRNIVPKMKIIHQHHLY